METHSSTQKQPPLLDAMHPLTERLAVGGLGTVFHGIGLLTAVLLSAVVGGCRNAEPRRVADRPTFPLADVVPLWSARTSEETGEPVGTSCVVGEVRDDALPVRFKPESDYPNLQFSPGNGLIRTDWSDYPVLRVVVANPGPTPVGLSCRVDTVEDGAPTHRQGACTLPPHSGPTEIFLKLFHLVIPDMKGQPPHRGVVTERGMWFAFRWTPVMTFTDVRTFQLFVAKPETSIDIDLHRIDLLRGDGLLDMRPFVDRFGQYTDLDWPTKVQDEADFAVREQEEHVDLARHPPPEDRDRYGGWESGPKLEATGRFRVAKHDGRWWFVTPEGRLFWSNGMDCVRAREVTFVTGREQWFRWLPEADEDPFGQFRRPFWNQDSMDFHGANLYRKYGEAWAGTFRTRALDRLRSWGFNTVANWSDPAVWEMRRMPYTVPVHVRCPGSPIPVALSPHHAKDFPDFFHPDFPKHLREALGKVEAYAGDPWLLGVFIDNEIPWAPWSNTDDDALPLSIVSHAVDSHTRRIALARLRSKYGDVDTLNRAWGTSLESWHALMADGCEFDAAREAAAKPDMQDLIRFVAEHYYSACRAAMDERMPGCLYLGSRLNVFTPDVVEVAARYCDAVSFNLYAETPGTAKQGHVDLAEKLDVPMLSTEYHFLAKDSGLLGTRPVTVETQEERAEGFRRYLADALSHPHCIGAHWFQYLDQPVTARPNGAENFNTGFVSVGDTPYPLLRAAARDVGRRIYRVRCPEH